MPADQEFEIFWDFSVRTYRTAGVADECLFLQNEFGADVNMLLYCCWAAAGFGKFDGELFDQACGLSDEWANNVVRPLRSARTWMKHTGCSLDAMSADDCMRLREEIKKLELGAEKLQQHTLGSLADKLQRQPAGRTSLAGDVSANLFMYLDYAAIEGSAEVRSRLVHIVVAAFPQLGIESVQTALGV